MILKLYFREENTLDKSRLRKICFWGMHGNTISRTPHSLWMMVWVAWPMTTPASKRCLRRLKQDEWLSVSAKTYPDLGVTLHWLGFTPTSPFPNCSGCFAFSRPSIANTLWFRPGAGGGLPAVLTSETSHSWLTRWHLCLECAFGNTNKNASQNSTLYREQKRAAFPKNSRKSGSKCLG